VCACVSVCRAVWRGGGERAGHGRGENKRPPVIRGTRMRRRRLSRAGRGVKHSAPWASEAPPRARTAAAPLLCPRFAALGDAWGALGQHLGGGAKGPRPLIHWRPHSRPGAWRRSASTHGMWGSAGARLHHLGWGWTEASRGLGDRRVHSRPVRAPAWQWDGRWTHACSPGIRLPAPVAALRALSSEPVPPAHQQPGPAAQSHWTARPPVSRPC
jgi:hypothetical protein